MTIELGSKVKKQWDELVESNQKVLLAKKDYNPNIKIPLTDITVDPETVFYFLKDFSTMLGENPNLFTLVHDGEKVLRAYAEGTLEKVYNSVIPLEFDGWEENLPINDLEATYKIVKRIAKEKTGIDIGILKSAHIDFFKEFEPVINAENTLDNLCNMYQCARNAKNKGLIEFYPEPNLMKILTWTEDIELEPEKLKKTIRKGVPRGRYGVLMKSDHGLIGLVAIKYKSDVHIVFPRKDVETIEGDSLYEMTKDFQKKLDLKSCIGLENNYVKEFLTELVKYDDPLEAIDETSDYFAKCGDGYVVGMNYLVDKIVEKSAFLFPGIIKRFMSRKK